jgi:hypothetical protein
MNLLLSASLVVTPTVYNEGTLFGIVPTNPTSNNADFSVTRATTATRVNAAGLVELVPYNLLTSSEDFTNVVWTKNPGVSVNANTATAPNGTLTADTIVGATGPYVFGGNNTFARGVGSLSSSTPYTFSVYLKGSGSVTITCRDGGTGLTNNVVCALSASWQRFEISRTTAAASTALAYVFSNASGNFDIWGAQLVEGASALDYQATETRLNIPRLDYSLGSCPNILLEPQRTNVLTFSEQLDNVSWGKIGASVTANSTTSPSGLVNADTFAGDGIIGGHYIGGNSVSFTSGSSYTTSIYAKKNTNNFIQIFIANTFGGMFANFDLNNGVVGNLGTVTGTAPTSSITNVGNDWYRCSMTFVPNSTGLGGAFFALVTSATSLRIEANTLSTSVFLWGAQLEAGAYATSYIPTVASTVTRNADVISKTGISSLIGQTEGTIFWEGQIDGRNTAYNEAIPISLFASGANISGAQIYLNFPSNGQIIYVVYDGTAVQALITTSPSFYTLGTYIKIAVAYKANDFVLYINGTQIGTDTNGSVPALADMYFDYQNLAGKYSTNAAALWKTRLTNAQLATLTTL